MKFRVLVAVVAVLLVLQVVAGELAGVSMPDEVSVGGRTLVLNGLGLREATWMKVDVYVAGLYLVEKTTDAQAIVDSDEAKQIVMKFVRKVKKKSITGAWDEGFEKNAGNVGKALAERVEQLNSYMVDFKKGDTMSFTYVSSTGVQVVVNGDSKGTIEGQDFARVLWSIWLGPEPPNPGIKSGMLGLD